jgi:hypothetical protein
MVHWTDHASPLDLIEFSWTASNAWAGQVVERNGTFCWYMPMRPRRTGRWRWRWPTVHRPVPGRSRTSARAEHQIDSTVFVDNDSQAHLATSNA